ncbi:Dabb family protein [Hufsiella ginkgonis]|uniref:Dabb family protein n=1 Tax=Hufsiella ginkgonis TaxID=2695274 RepID=A0A7K1Y1W3_9SPHI|nr:Dabb family protein [Hufsiella ginkgonis]MXV17097.1 Dabb family protein [Hufsiella ginkgonis]
MFSHHVLFYLKEKDNAAHLAELKAGLQGLVNISSIEKSYIGVPAGTSRDVVDASYSASWLLFFADAAAHDSYQVDPVHLAFISKCAHLWEKVIVFDDHIG